MSEGLSYNPLHEKYPDLHKSEYVQQAAERHQRNTGERIHSPSEKLDAWMDTLEQVHIDRDPDVSQRIKDVYHRQYVMQPQDVPQAYFDQQVRIARERGHGDVAISPEARREMADTITRDQERSLDRWIDYLSSKDAAYPMWFKYYTFRNVVKLADYDKDKGEFRKRSRTTTSPFPDLNREALSYVADALSAKYGLTGKDREAGPEEFDPRTKELLDRDASFGVLYAHAIEKVQPASKEALAVTEGQWVKYDQGSDGAALARTLQGHGTGWCTAGEGTAQSQLDVGDFYVYYSKDPTGNATVPRVAIRMEEGQIAEVRGIEADQNLEPELVEIARTKMAELPGAQAYEKKTSDMQKLTAIEAKDNSGQELTVEELRFLYEADSKIEGFGYTKDPRIKQLMMPRDPRADLSRIYECRPDQVAFGQFDLKPTSVVLFGDLSRNDPDTGLHEAPSQPLWKRLTQRSTAKPWEASVARAYPSLKIVHGNVIEHNLIDLGDIEEVTGDLSTWSSRIPDLGRLRRIGGNGIFNQPSPGSSYTRSGIVSLGQLESIGGHASFDYSSIQDLGELREIGGMAKFTESEITNLGMLEKIGGDVWFAFSKVSNLGSLREIGGNIRIDNDNTLDFSGISYRDIELQRLRLKYMFE